MGLNKTNFMLRHEKIERRMLFYRHMFRKVLYDCRVLFIEYLSKSDTVILLDLISEIVDAGLSQIT